MNGFRLILFSLCFLWEIDAWSIIAYPHKIPVVVDGDTTYIRLYGDEHMKFAEDEKGYTIVQKNCQWYYACRNSNGYLEASDYIMTKNQSAGLKEFLNQTPKHIRAVQKAESQIAPTALPYELKKSKAIGERKVLVILMQYKDLKLKKTLADFNSLFNDENYLTDGAQGSVKDYYRNVSYGKLLLTSDIIGPFTSQREMSFYGANDIRGNDKNTLVLFTEAIENAANYVNLKEYDVDDDGYVDNVHIIFAGYGEEAGGQDYAIWSHEATFFQPYTIQGVKIDRYSCAPELRGNYGNGISRIGPHCHEIGHALGAMDYYDTNYSTNGEYKGTGVWDVMASGSWNNEGITPADFNPYVKAYDFGWIDLNPLPLGDVSIKPSYFDGESYYKLVSEEVRDFYIIENRSRDKWGSALPGDGLLIFHVDPLLKESGNKINSTAPQLCYVVCASSMSQVPGYASSTYGDINSSGCPYPGSSNNHNFGSSSIPKAFYWNDEMCNIELSDIQLSADGQIRLKNNSFNPGEDDRKQLYFEGFEQQEINVQIGDNFDINRWHVVENPDAFLKIVDRPIAYAGNKCLQLSAKKSDEPRTSMLTFSVGDVNREGELGLRFYYTSFNSTILTPNELIISYRLGEAGDWYATNVQSYQNNVWSATTVDIPLNEFSQGTIVDVKIEGTAQPGSTLAIDNIEVIQKYNKETEIVNVYSGEIINSSDFNAPIYDLMGRRLLQKPSNGYYIQGGKKYLAQ